MIMEDLPADQWEVAFRLLNALTKPTGKNGTGNQKQRHRAAISAAWLMKEEKND